jgi:bifunctional UDP-N-acetylglucosamine pyrophosphorylase/glucosamine-1-phosphate N-acetyltransferase
MGTRIHIASTHVTPMTTLPLSVIILAAGKGTRMKSDKAKVLHEVFYAPMVHHVINATLPLQPVQTVVIVGHQHTAVRQALEPFAVDFVQQKEQLGTGHAVLVAENSVAESAETVMILCGDTPLIKAETLLEMYERHCQQQAALTLMTTVLEDPTNYGRILSDPRDKVLGIVEQKDATRQQLAIQEINAGIYCVDKKFLFSALKKVGTDNSQGEVYLTDIVKLAVDSGLIVEKYIALTPLDVLGVNSRVELADAQRELQMRQNRMLMLKGVSMHNPETISVSPDSSLGCDTLLGPSVNISNRTQIGNSCTIGQGTILHNCHIGDQVSIGPYSYLSDCTITDNTTLPPFSKNC